MERTEGAASARWTGIVSYLRNLDIADRGEVGAVRRAVPRAG